ncbi:MAG: plasmid pRiA4b ORF-3 family protein [Betaproteobacteria bacterium]|nr:plasmid pRiA4b ORF-3 family protein [Betaproteobacteria bacterium]
MAEVLAFPGKQWLRLRIELLGVSPLVWRRFVVPRKVTLGKLHRVIQEVMGWEDYHLHEFIIAGQRYGLPDPEFDGREAPLSEKRVALSTPLGEFKSFQYDYDFGDGWEHLVIVEGVLPPEEVPDTFICLAGENACPPEDVGGPPGYMNYLEALLNPRHDAHEEMLEWRGRFDPKKFNLRAINKRLACIKP